MAVLLIAALTPCPAAAQWTFRADAVAAPFDWASAVADFNADGRPDFAVASRVGTHGSSRYRIDVQLSATRKELITFDSTAGAVRIRAIDVDHDHDVDLVATPIVGGHVIGVWLNDGSGHFVESDVTKVPDDSFAPAPATLNGSAFTHFSALPPPRRIHDVARAPYTLVIGVGNGGTAFRTADPSNGRPFTQRPSSPRAPPTPSFLL